MIIAFLTVCQDRALDQETREKVEMSRDVSKTGVKKRDAGRCRCRWEFFFSRGKRGEMRKLD